MNRLFLFLLLICIHACKDDELQVFPDNPQTEPLENVRIRMVDSLATDETVQLYQFLLEHTQKGSGILYGHESSNLQGWSFNKFNPNRLQSDVLTSIGDLPAVFGYDFNRGYQTMLSVAMQAASVGGIVTISNHMKFPTTNSYHFSDIRHLVNNPVQAVLPGGDYHQNFLDELDRIADFARKLTINGKQVPILFRPWHEHTGGWFWWGTDACTEEQFCDLWQFTVKYLRDIKQIHSLIYVFSPSRPGQRGGYTFRNPGMQWFDVAGFDCYHTSEEEGTNEFMINAKETAEYALKNGKIAAFAEFGYKKGIDKCTNSNWYSECFLTPLSENDLLSVFAYGMNWQDSDDGYSIPKQTDLQYEDFVRFHNHEEIHFLHEIQGSK